MTSRFRLQINAADSNQQQYSSEARDRLSASERANQKVGIELSTATEREKYVPLQPL